MKVIKLIIDCHDSRAMDAEKYIRSGPIYIHNLITINANETNFSACTIWIQLTPRVSKMCISDFINNEEMFLRLDVLNFKKLDYFLRVRYYFSTYDGFYLPFYQTLQKSANATSIELSQDATNRIHWRCAGSMLFILVFSSSRHFVDSIHWTIILWFSMQTQSNLFTTLFGWMEIQLHTTRKCLIILSCL